MSWTNMVVHIVAMICVTGLLAFIIEKICRAVERCKNRKQQAKQFEKVMEKLK